MFFRFFFTRMSLQKQAMHLRKKGIMLGTRVKDGRTIHIYMLKDLFVEVIFKADNLENEAESLKIVRGLDNLNQYLENEFRASF